jgi:hypothetical protein
MEKMTQYAQQYQLAGDRGFAVGQPAADDMATAQTAALEALRDHWWVRWQQGSTVGGPGSDLRGG